MKTSIIQYNSWVCTKKKKKKGFPLVDPPVLAKVDQYAEIDYSMVRSPVISNTSIDLGLKVNLSTTLYFFKPCQILCKKK